MVPDLMESKLKTEYITKNRKRILFFAEVKL